MKNTFRRPKKFKKYNFKLSANQANSLSNYCKLNHTTPNKLIKSLLKIYTEDYSDKKLNDEQIDSAQLRLFQEDIQDYSQMKLFDNDSEK